MTHLQPLEIASGAVIEALGVSGLSAPAPVARQARGASRRALEQLLIEAYCDGPVSISFSGGRDSSLILAVATRVARLHGFDDPVPITLRHDSPASDEAAEQELVLRHLGVKEWLKVDAGDSLDVLGELATSVYRELGILTPPNAYLHEAIVRVAPPGHLLTGNGGDEVLGTAGWHVAQVLSGRVPPRLSDLGRLAFAAAPSSLRRSLMRSRTAGPLPWLTVTANRELSRLLADELVQTRLRWDSGAVIWARSRGQVSARRSLDLLARDRVRISSPLLDERFVRAFAGEVGFAGPPSRTAATQLLAGDLLPDRSVGRRSKASFGQLVWGPSFRRFVDQWDPESLDVSIRDLLDVTGLRKTWVAPEPHFLSMLLAQKAWMDQSSA